MKNFNTFVVEDLRKWFSKTDPSGDWKRINSKGEAIGPCAREPGEPKPKCMSRAKRASLSKKERASAVAAKRKHDPNPPASNDTFDFAMPDIPEPPQSEKPEPKDKDAVGFKFGFIGAGQGGGKLAETFSQIGYARVGVINTVTTTPNESELIK